MSNSPTIDMTRGLYRRIYANFRNGRRICSVSLEAEAWFWRLTVSADDFGNTIADPSQLRNDAAGRRDITVAQSEQWLEQLANARLVQIYQVGEERYIHIIGFCDYQPANRSGRRVQRCPQPPDSPGLPTIPPDSSRLPEAPQDSPAFPRINETPPSGNGDDLGNGEGDRGRRGIDAIPGIDTPGIREALAEFTAWSERDRHVALDLTGDCEPQTLVRELLLPAATDTKVVHGGEQVAPLLLVPLAVKACMNEGTEFKSVSYAMKCVKSRIKTWSTRGIEKAPGTSTNGTHKRRPVGRYS